MDKAHYTYKDVRNLTDQDLNQQIFVRGRIHTIRTNGNFCFLLIRYQQYTLQVIAHKKTLGVDKYKTLKSYTCETVIDCYGTLNPSPIKIKTASYHDFELALEDYELISLARDLPFQIDDAIHAGEEDNNRSNVGLDTRLNSRWIDLRTPINNSIFKIQSAITQYFRQYLIQNKFTEIHSPKIIGVVTSSINLIFPYIFCYISLILN